MVNYTRTYAPRPCIKCEAVIESPKGPQRYCAHCRTTCEVDGCTSQVRSNGRCDTHNRNKFAVTALEPIDGKCGVVGCGRSLRQKGMCMLHYGRAFRLGDVGDAEARKTNPVGAPCLVDGCGKPARGRGYCGTHYRRLRVTGDAGGVELLRGPQGEGSINDKGYRVIRVNGETVFEHRHVMEQKLGRKLRDSENVHHIDGDKLNNDPSNLELWSRYQPSGQRVRDKISAAVKLLREHPDTLADEGLRLIALESQEATDLLADEGFGEVSDSILGVMSYGA